MAFSMICSKLSDTHQVSWGDPAPERYIYVALLLSSRPFGFEIFHRGCRGDGIDGHIHNCCYAAGGCSSGSSCKPFPVFSARLIQVDVGTVHQIYHQTFVVDGTTHSTRPGNTTLSPASIHVMSSSSVLLWRMSRV